MQVCTMRLHSKGALQKREERRLANGEWAACLGRPPPAPPA